MRAIAAMLLLGSAVAACAATLAERRPRHNASAVMPKVVANWRSMATDADRKRLRDWRTTWLEAVERARKSGAGAAIAAEGALFDPDRALATALPPAGNYQCRTFKLGARGTAMTDFTAYPAYACEVNDEGEVASFHTMTGGQRPVGILFRDSDARAVFLGTLAIGDETKLMAYGRDASRDIIGYIERVGERRWRLVQPAPAFESLLNIIELTPAKG
ncbi:MAG: DUF4893 domain-containing protein [Sphingomonas sp.]